MQCSWLKVSPTCACLPYTCPPAWHHRATHKHSLASAKNMFVAVTLQTWRVCLTAQAALSPSKDSEATCAITYAHKAGLHRRVPAGLAASAGQGPANADCFACKR